MIWVVPLRFHSGDASAASIEIAHQVSRVFDGRLHFDIHDGLEQSGFSGLHGIPERLSCRQFEREFRRVDIMIGAVVDGDFEIDHGKSRQEASFGGFDYSFFHSWYIVFGN